MTAGRMNLSICLHSQCVTLAKNKFLSVCYELSPTKYVEILTPSSSEYDLFGNRMVTDFIS